MTVNEILYRNNFIAITKLEKELDELDSNCGKCTDKYLCIVDGKAESFSLKGIDLHKWHCHENVEQRKIFILKELNHRVNFVLANQEEILASHNIHWQHKLRVMQLKGCFE